MPFCSDCECLVSLPFFPFPLWGNLFACVHVSVFCLPIFRTTRYSVHKESAMQHLSKNSLCSEVLNVLDWGSDSGSFIIWELVGRCDRKSALDRFCCILLDQWDTIFNKLHAALYVQGLAFPLLRS